MKKIFAVLLTIAMVATLSVPALAAEELTESPATGKAAGDYSIGVQATYVAGAASAQVISVDIAWGEMSFTYTGGSLGDWQAGSHTYTGAQPGAWSNNKPNITLINHSNTEVVAEFTFTPESEVTTTGTFYTSENQAEAEPTYTALTVAEQELTLATAVDTTQENAPEGTLYFGVSGDAVAADQKLGTITVTIVPVAEVSTGSELTAAVNNGGRIKLMNDITIVNGFTFTSAKNLNLNLNGKTLTVENNQAFVPYTGNCVLTVTNGTISSLSGASVIDVRYGSCTIRNCTLQTASGISWTVYNRGTAVLTDCIINSGFCCSSYSNTSSTTTLINCTVSGDISVSNNSTLTLDFDPSDQLSGYNEGVVTNNGDGTWTVQS